jgi:hypothetical protein
MPKRAEDGIQPKFLQFRPLHAFTTKAPDRWRSSGVQRILLLLGVIAALAIVVMAVLHSR